MILKTLTELCHERLDLVFEKYLFNPTYADKKIQEAIQYSVANGGKRIRPLFVYATGLVFDTPLENLDAPACAIELIHTYSLIHDDLPAMDNSDLRRGKPSCHKKFNEAVAILAGDALQPLAFEILGTHHCSLNTEQRLEMINVLSIASGIKGMAAGQGLDLAGVHSLEQLNEMYLLKTGALLEASVKLGLIATRTKDFAILKAFSKYIKNIGLAFQIQDDLLDAQGNSEKLGKPTGQDTANKKTTYPNLLGIEKTQSIVSSLFTEALQEIAFLGKNAEILRELAYYLLHREH